MAHAYWRSVTTGAGHLWWTFGNSPKVDALAVVLFARDPVVDGLAISTLKERVGFQPPEHARKAMAGGEGPRIYNLFFTERNRRR
jgi:hypothetical protein